MSLILQALNRRNGVRLQPQALELRVILETGDFIKALEVKVQNVIQRGIQVKVVLLAKCADTLRGHPEETKDKKATQLFVNVLDLNYCLCNSLVRRSRNSDHFLLTKDMSSSQVNKMDSHTICEGSEVLT